MNTSVSVILPYYNGSKFVESAIQSVLNQTCPPLELIVINDGSNQEEAGFLDRFKSERLTIINQENMGVSSARNTGIEKAKGEWIAFIDQDDRWEPNKLELQIAYLRDNSDCRALHTAVKSIKANGQIIVHRKWRLSKADFLEIFPCPAYLSSTILAKSLLMEAGLFDPTLKYSQDCECFLRCSLLTPFHYLDEVLTVRLKHEFNLSSDSRGVWNDRANIIRKYQSEFDDPSIFNKSLSSIHEQFALLAFHQRNWKLVSNIISAVASDQLSRTRFFCNLVLRKFSNSTR